MKKSKSYHISKLSASSLFTALITIGAYIQIPASPLPITMQTIFVILSGIILDGRYGALSSLIYMLMGILGIPVFSGGGGIGYILRPSFGFIIGFIPASFIAGSIADFAGRRVSTPRIIAAFIAGEAVIYLIGITYGIIILCLTSEEFAAISSYIATGVIPTLPGELLSCVVGIVAATRLLPPLKKSQIANGR